MNNILKKEECSGVWVFTEIQDHERVLEGALEILSKGRLLADRLGEKLTSLLFALDAGQYIDEVKKTGPDIILYCSHRRLKHYESQIFPDMFTDLIKKEKPSIILFPSTEAGKDLAPRLAQRFSTGLTAHCSGLEIIDSEEWGKGILSMKRPAFSGNLVTEIVCPEKRPQLATVQPGVFQKRERDKDTEIKEIPFSYDLSKINVKCLRDPLRWDRKHVPLELADIIISGGRGISSKKCFNKLYELADLLGGEVGATRVPVFNEWCGEERMIGQTGKTVKPKLYLSFGVSGQIQHTASIVDSDIIISVNTDDRALIHGMSDYVVIEDAPGFLDRLIERIKLERRESVK